ncbi:MAG: acetoacetate decarboxylase family protein [Polyangiales bacterium]
MAKLRYVREMKQVAARKGGAGGMKNVVQSIRARYETDPEIAAALLPKPLVAAASPEIFVQFANVTMHFKNDHVMTVGAATVGVACTYEGRPGHYVLAMPMEGEFVVIGGREKFGEPKKIATTEFTRNDARVGAKVSRHGITFLELHGKLGAPSERERVFTEHFFCFKAMPAIDGNGGFDGDVFLTQLNWERNYDSIHHIEDGEVILRESVFDPLVDVPVRRLVSMEFAEGASTTSGEILRQVPGEWLEPFLVQRYDDPTRGVEITLASEGTKNDG